MIRPVLVLPAILAGATLLGAQQPTFRGGTHTVSLYATVVDHNGRLVPSLTQDDFEVYDNGKRQTLTVFKNDLQPITIVIMLDRSGSMVANFPIERAAAQQFISELLPEDKARLGSFSNRVQIDPEGFTSDREELSRILEDRLQSSGPTPLWNATFAAMNALERQEGRRVVLVFTDGYDSPGTPRRVTLDDVIARSQSQEIMVYAIGLADPCDRGGLSPAAPSVAPRFQRGRPPGGGGGGRPPMIPRIPGGIGGRPPMFPPRPLPIPGSGPEMPGPRGPVGRPPATSYGNGCGNSKPDSGLKLLAEEGGGGYFELHNTDDLVTTFSRVADELHHQYLLAFQADALDGKMHTLDVRVRNAGLVPRARKSYLAPLASPNAAK